MKNKTKAILYTIAGLFLTGGAIDEYRLRESKSPVSYAQTVATRKAVNFLEDYNGSNNKIPLMVAQDALCPWINHSTTASNLNQDITAILSSTQQNPNSTAFKEHKKEIAGRMDDLAMKEGQNGFSVFLGILGLTSLLGGLFNYRKQD